MKSLSGIAPRASRAGTCRSRRVAAWLVAAGLSFGAAEAQIHIPFMDTPPAAPAAAPPPAEAPPTDLTPASPDKPKRHFHRGPPARAASVKPDPAGALGRVLKLNGRNGELRLERGDDGALRIVKYTLLGEVVSKPEQRCRIDIVADQPIAASAKGEPDGLARYSADIPACPLAFDIVSDGVLVPAQTNACVFAAADCQASPSGLWGPEAAELDKDPKAILKARAAADRSIQDSLREMEKRDKDAAASLAREQNDFAAERDDVCRDYAGEARLGFCASRLAQSRAALLARRAGEAEAAPAHAAPERKRRKNKAP
jgi:hypothetical protein